MKKTAIILFLVLAIPALLTSCLFDEEDLFDKSASERIEAAKQEAKTVLESAENGWHVRYFPSPTQEFGGYNLFFKKKFGAAIVYTRYLVSIYRAIKLVKIGQSVHIHMALVLF